MKAVTAGGIGLDLGSPSGGICLSYNMVYDCIHGSDTDLSSGRETISAKLHVTHMKTNSLEFWCEIICCGIMMFNTSSLAYTLESAATETQLIRADTF